MARKKVTADAMRKLFTRNFAKRMEDLGLDNPRLAEKMKIPRSHVWSYANGQTWPSLDRYAALCQHLDVEPDYFLRPLG